MGNTMTNKPPPHSNHKYISINIKRKQKKNFVNESYIDKGWNLNNK